MTVTSTTALTSMVMKKVATTAPTNSPVQSSSESHTVTSDIPEMMKGHLRPGSVELIIGYKPLVSFPSQRARTIPNSAIPLISIDYAIHQQVWAKCC